MKKTPHPIQNISDVLQKDPTIFSLITKAKEIEMLDGLVKKEIGSDLLDHCQVASYEKGVLTLITTSNAFATQLRFKSFDIRDKLRQTPKWSGLSRIQIGRAISVFRGRYRWCAIAIKSWLPGGMGKETWAAFGGVAELACPVDECWLQYFDRCEPFGGADDLCLCRKYGNSARNGHRTGSC